MRQDHRGITLVELIIAISITVIITAAAALFLKTALDSYHTASNTIDLQMETQVLMDQVGTWIMEGNSVKQEGDAYVIYDIPKLVDAAKMPEGVTPDPGDYSKRVLWVYEGKMYMMFYSNLPRAGLASDTTTINNATMAVDENCIGQYVSEFRADTVTNNPKLVTLYMKLTAGKQIYDMTNTIEMRNEPVEVSRIENGKERSI